MKNVLKLCSLIFVVVLTACGGGGSSSSDTKNEDGSVTKTLSVTKDATSVKLDGKDGDKLSLSVPSLPLGSEDIEVNFKLLYSDGSTLPTLVIDKEIEFVLGVSFSFKSSELVNGDYVLIYLNDDGKEYMIPYTQDGDTITATLTHFSSYTITPAKSQSTIEANVDAHLTSWEANNASKKMEDIGLDSINSLYAEIKSITDSTKQAAFIKRFEEALIVLAGNSLSDWRSIDIDYFTKYCMTQEFKDTVTKFARLYSLFDNFETSNDNVFNMLKDEIVKIIDKELSFSYGEWLLITPPCDTIDTQAYVKCASTYEDFVIDTLLVYFNGRASFDNDNDIMKEAEDKISLMAEEAMNNSQCECLAVYKSVLTEYFKDTQSSLISDINSFMSDRCENSCPYIWNIEFTQNFMASESGESLHYITKLSFKNVFIYPRGSYDLSSKERESCSTYIDEYGVSTNTKATSYSATEEGYEFLEDAPSFQYIGLNPDGLEDTRDPDYDISFDKLSSVYKKGTDGEINDYHQDGWPSLSGDGYHFTGYTDIFEEIYLYKAFSVGGNKGTFSFTPSGQR